jgi:F420-dependent oxidoreductase-like protein
MTIFGFKVANERIEWPTLRQFWLLADETSEFDVGWNYDHFYPIYGGAGEPCLEGWTMLAALAEATDRLRIGCLVSAVPYRHPAVLANMAATVDQVSEGRLELGLGAGWHEAEASAYGLTLPADIGARFDLFDEACEIVVSLLTHTRTSFDGEYFQVADAHLEPKGVQQPPPVTIGGTGPKRTLRAVARFADWWNLPFFDPDSYRDGRNTLTEHCANVGRDPATIRHSAHVMVAADASSAEIAENVGASIEAGLDQPILYFQPPYDLAVVNRAATAIRSLAPTAQSRR